MNCMDDIRLIFTQWRMNGVCRRDYPIGPHVLESMQVVVKKVLT